MSLSRAFKKAAVCTLVTAVGLVSASSGVLLRQNPPGLTQHIDRGDCTELPMASAPLRNGYAHNDYLHNAPLLEALQNGFGAIEADLVLENGQILVGHAADDPTINPDFNLEALYLEPLQRLVRQNGGHVYPDSGKTFLLMLDSKSDGASVYKALQPIFNHYKGMLTSYDNGHIYWGAVTIVMTGNQSQRPLMAAQKLRYAALDGKPSELGGRPPDRVPIVSRNWSVLFDWNGQGEMPKAEYRKLRNIVRTAHGDGQKIRFWSAPDTPNSWQTQTKAGVDYINTNNLKGFSAWAAQANPREADLRTKIVKVNCPAKISLPG